VERANETAERDKPRDKPLEEPLDEAGTGAGCALCDLSGVGGTSPTRFSRIRFKEETAGFASGWGRGAEDGGGMSGWAAVGLPNRGIAARSTEGIVDGFVERGASEGATIGVGRCETSWSIASILTSSM
jgi:hypothetical protein